MMMIIIITFYSPDHLGGACAETVPKLCTLQ